VSSFVLKIRTANLESFSLTGVTPAFSLTTPPDLLAKNSLETQMPCLVPISPETLNMLKLERETGPGYHVVSVELNDGKLFEQVVISAGCVIAVRGQQEVPFRPDEIRNVTVNHRVWNFRRWCERDRQALRVKSAAA